MSSDSSQAIVYIVDDDASIRASLSALLEVNDILSEAFASPAEFLSEADTSKNCCLIVDARLPGMSGLELLAQLSIDVRTIPSFMITGHGESNLLEVAKERGVIECFRKPFDCDQLVASVQLAMQKLTGMVSDSGIRV